MYARTPIPHPWLSDSKEVSGSKLLFAYILAVNEHPGCDVIAYLYIRQMAQFHIYFIFYSCTSKTSIFLKLLNFCAKKMKYRTFVASFD